MNHDYKYEQMYQEGHMSEEDRNGLIPAIRHVPAHEVRDSVNHCQCRSGSPDTCPICTDMETGEKYADQDQETTPNT